MTRAEQLRADYNRAFYPDGRTFNRYARIFIEHATISIDGEVYNVPKLDVAPQTSMRDIVRLMIVHLGNLPATEAERLVPPAKKKIGLKAIEHTTYRGTPYLVQHLVKEDEDIFIVIRDADDKDKGKELSPNSPAFRAIVKQYKAKKAEQQSIPAIQTEEE
jgi:ribosomal protein S4